MKILVWLRQDLRLTDNPALAAAAKQGEVIPVYIWSPKEEGKWAPGLQSRIWLHHALKAFEAPLALRKGPTLQALQKLIGETKAEALYFNRRYEPAALKRDQKIMEALAIEVKTFNASLLIEPGEMKPYKVFTPFWKTGLKHAPFPPLGKPRFHTPKRMPRSETLDLPNRALEWEVGEKAALKKLQNFLKSTRQNSELSPHLHFGEIGPRQVWALAKKKPDFIRQLFWREFAYHLLVHFPQTPQEPFRPNYAQFPWRRDPKGLKAWKEGKTGYPIVDAAMRQLVETGWMPNRMRMIVASFLTKDLLIPWQEGAKWFWERLVDADLANNTLGWQWTAGCGADAAPYFRVFNPTRQSAQYDPDGEYIRSYVPELANVQTKWIHAPWESPDPVPNYPKPIVEHQMARKRALQAFEKVKNENRNHRK